MIEKIRYIACSVQGTIHKAKNIPCQDKVYVNVFKPSRYERVGIFALADGAGSVKNSQIGAEIVTKRFVNFWKEIIQDINHIIRYKKTLTKILTRTKALSHVSSIKLVNLQSLYDLFTDVYLSEFLMKVAFKNSRDALFEFEGQENSKNEKNSGYSSTLVGCVYYLNIKYHYSTIVCSSIGDSVAFSIGYSQENITNLRENKEIMHKKEYDWDFSFPCKTISECTLSNLKLSVFVATRITKGEFANETVFLDSSNWANYQTFSKIEYPLGLIMSSDGLEKVYFRYVQDAQNFWSVVLIDDFLKKIYMDFSSKVITNRRLTKILNLNEIHEINSDDKSIVVATFPTYIKRRMNVIIKK